MACKSPYVLFEMALGEIGFHTVGREPICHKDELHYTVQNFSDPNCVHTLKIDRCSFDMLEHMNSARRLVKKHLWDRGWREGKMKDNSPPAYTATTTSTQDCPTSEDVIKEMQKIREQENKAAEQALINDLRAQGPLTPFAVLQGIQQAHLTTFAHTGQHSRPEDRTPDQQAPPLWEVAAEIARQVPDADWAKVPSDLAKNVDHYLYGTPKRKDNA